MENKRRMMISCVILLVGFGMMQAFQIGNFNFGILSEEERTVDIAWNYTGAPYDKDTLDIPQTVIFEGKEYTVTEVREHGFCGRHNYLNFDNVLKLPPSIKKIGEDGFITTNFQEVTIPDSVTIDFAAFLDCFWIEKLNLGRGCRIDKHAFEHNVSATELQIPSGTIIEAASFKYWQYLRKLELGEDISIHSLAYFGGCQFYYDWEYGDFYPWAIYKGEGDPMTVIYHTSNPPYVPLYREGCEIFSKKTFEEGVLYMKDETGVAAARVTYPWSQFNRVLPLSEYNAVKDVVDEERLESAPEQIFTLNGLPVNTPRECLRAGIYIVRKGAKVSKISVP